MYAHKLEIYLKIIACVDVNCSYAPEIFYCKFVLVLQAFLQHW